jgi:glutamyl/glutaminyl-tRNA synthetase
MTAHMPSFKRTRIAPTPSGYLHLGNVLSFALTATLAQKTNATILLRIDDLDKERVNGAYLEDIFDTMRFLDIPWHEGPKDINDHETTYSQLRRMELYEHALQQLKETGNLFACTCSRTQVRSVNNDDIYPGTCRYKNIPLDTPNASWRLKTIAAEISVNIFPAKKTALALPASMQDFVVRKKDGFPAYQLTSVVDDLYHGVDLVVRGEDLRDSTLAQLYLSSQLPPNRFINTNFYHHPLLIFNGTKLSKSAGATSVQYLRGQGQKASGIYSSIAQMMGIDAVITNWQTLGEAVYKE